MSIYIAEIIGTFLLILLGNGVVANVVLKDTKAQGSGWMVIASAWAFAVFVGVTVAGPYSGAHINPAVTLGLAMAGKFAWTEVPAFILAQVFGAMLGSLGVWLSYKKHYDITDDQGGILATFSTGPAIRKPFFNMLSELIGTFVLVFTVFYITGATDSSGQPLGLGSVGALPVAILVWSIGLSLGGTTGYAINPARDFGPRIMHSILPIPKKGSSDWSYAWVPIVGPVLGAALAAGLALSLGF